MATPLANNGDQTRPDSTRVWSMTIDPGSNPSVKIEAPPST
jgi:hypothetical protein